MQKKVIIIGAGGHAKVIADIIHLNGDEVVGFLDDNEEVQGNIITQNKKVLGKIADFKDFNDCKFVIGIGNNKIRKIIAQTYKLNYYTAIHPKSVIASDVKIDEGTVIMAGTVINPGTTIGKHCIINTSASLDHDNIIEDFVHISPGSHLAGSVTIKEGTWICIGVTVINNISINKNNIIGAGATVIKNIEDEGKTYIGVPSHAINK